MSHCPQCGRATPFEGAAACPFCGAALGAARAPGAPKLAARTMVGVSVHDLPLPPAAAPAPAAGAVPAKANRTIVGMPASAVTPGAAQQPLQGSEPAGAPKIPSQLNRTIVGMTQPLGSKVFPQLGYDGSSAPLPPVPPTPASGTLLGVARPGIAPLAPGIPREAEDDVDESEIAQPNPVATGELGATVGPAALGAWPPAPPPPRNDPRRRRHLPAAESVAPKPRKPKEGISKRALAVVIAAGVLALGAVLFALLWPSAPPITARARADAEGREGVELRCTNCPDGTKVGIGEASATMTGGAALVPLSSALSLGENRMKVAIDRPAPGRDEVVGVVLNVAYRIRPDLSTLQGERPSIQIIAEAAKGTSISIDGRPLPTSGGRAVESIDVTESCTGMAGEPRSLTRQIPYTVTPESGPVEKGMVNISVGIVPLQIEAPGPHVTIDGPSFILAGRTMKGAEVLAAGRPITVKPDGTFGQQMNVSSIGATQIEVRAKVTGLAPRLVKIKVRRVDNLETAAREFASESPISFAPLSQNIAGQIGKAVALTGDVLESRVQGSETVMLLDVSHASGCPASGGCTVRLIQGAKNEAKKGDTLRVFGHVTRAFSTPGRADIPEIEVDFTLKGQK